MLIQLDKSNDFFMAKVKAAVTLREGTMSQMTIWGHSFLGIVISSGILVARLGIAESVIVLVSFVNNAAKIIPQVSDIAYTCWR